MNCLTGLLIPYCSTFVSHVAFTSSSCDVFRCPCPAQPPSSLPLSFLLLFPLLLTSFLCPLSRCCTCSQHEITGSHHYTEGQKRECLFLFSFFLFPCSFFVSLAFFFSSGTRLGAVRKSLALFSQPAHLCPHRFLITSLSCLSASPFLSNQIKSYFLQNRSG